MLLRIISSIDILYKSTYIYGYYLTNIAAIYFRHTKECVATCMNTEYTPTDRTTLPVFFCFLYHKSSTITIMMTMTQTTRPSTHPTTIPTTLEDESLLPVRSSLDDVINVEDAINVEEAITFAVTVVVEAGVTNVVPYIMTDVMMSTVVVTVDISDAV